MNSYGKVTTLLFIFSLSLFAQANRGNASEIKETILKGNQITSVVFNYGSFGKPNYLSQVGDLVWNGLGYLFEFGPLLAAEVTGADGKTYHVMDDSYVLNGQGGYSPDGTVKWGWLPRTGYCNPNQKEIATAQNPASWPSTWAKWPGENGDGVIISEDEAYYVMDDFTNSEFPYYPFPNDTTKRGLGVSAEVRIYQFGGDYKNSLIVKYRITNESQKTLSKVYFGFMGDPHIGGYSDYSDDMINYMGENTPSVIQTREIPFRNSVWVWDYDNKGIGGKEPGILSFKLLDTPDNLGMTFCHPDGYTNSLPNVPKNRDLMWKWFTSGIDTTSSLLNKPADNIVNFGTGPFTLKPGESKDIKLSITVSANSITRLRDMTALHYKSNWMTINNNAGTEGGNQNFKISLTSLNDGTVKGVVPFTWKYSGNYSTAKVYCEYSSDCGITWIPLKTEMPVNGSFTVNTEDLNDGVNYLVRAIAYNPNNIAQYYYFTSKNRFTVNNSVNAKPEVKFINSFNKLTLKNTPFEVKWVNEDADDSLLTASLSYSANPDGPFTTVFNNKNVSYGSNSFVWDFSSLPNYDTYYLKLTVSDGKTDSTVITKPFSIQQQYGEYNNNVFTHIYGNATPNLQLLVVNKNDITGDNYELSFADSADVKYATIKDVSKGKIVLSGVKLQAGMSTPYFDGLKINISDLKTSLNLGACKFNRPELNSVTSITNSTLGGTIINAAEDWAIVFNNLDTLADGKYKEPGDTVLNTFKLNTICPFKIINTTYGAKANYIIYEPNANGKNNGRWDANEIIVLKPQNSSSNTITSYSVSFGFTNMLKPLKGDTLRVITYKEITGSDVFRFVADNSYVLGVKDKYTVEPGKYMLLQNYPNPFNPSTIISYNLAASGKVSLKIYDILGKEIAVLVNGAESAGLHKVSFDASRYGLSSGMYFYSLDAGSYHKTGKMLLIK